MKERKMDYLKLKPTNKRVAIKTQDQVKELPEYEGPRGWKYYFDFCYFGGCNFDDSNFDVYQDRTGRDVRVAINVNGYRED